MCHCTAVDGGVIHLNSTFRHEFFDVARAQGIGPISADAQENDILGEMDTLKADRQCRLPHYLLWITEGDHTPNSLK
jgi:hypothetical protein